MLNFFEFSGVEVKEEGGAAGSASLPLVTRTLNNLV
jgi:hypothetical protein